MHPGTTGGPFLGQLVSWDQAAAYWQEVASSFVGIYIWPDPSDYDARIIDPGICNLILVIPSICADLFDVVISKKRGK